MDEMGWDEWMERAMLHGGMIIINCLALALVASATEASQC
jgi:hypothetical protein